MLLTILLFCSTLIRGTLIIGDSMSEPIPNTTWSSHWKSDNPSTQVLWRRGVGVNWLIQNQKRIPPNTRVIIYIGINDIWNGRTPKQTADGIQGVIDHVNLKCGQAVIVSGVYHPHTGQTYKEFIYSHWVGATIIPPLALSRSAFSSDGIHLTANGHLKLYKWIVKHY